ncbi:GntP family transporter [Corynebacterium sp. Marseille-Q2516]
MTGMALLGVGIAAVALLLALVIWGRLPAFVALILVSVITAIVAGIPLADATGTVTKGIGNTLSSVLVVVGLGAMLGRMIEASGGADSLATYFTLKLGKKRVVAAVTIAAFILGIPVFFDVGFIILAPIIFAFARVVGLNPLKIGLPVAGIMLTVHVVTPPHPGPVAAAGLLDADLGLVLAFSLPLAALAGVAGYWLARLIRVDTVTLLDSPATEAPPVSDTVPPRPGIVMGLILLPIAQIMVGTVGSLLLDDHPIITFLGSAPIALLTAVLVAFVVLGRDQGWDLTRRSTILDSALPDVAVIIFVTGAGGGFANVLVESGIGQVVSDMLIATAMPLILLAYVLSLLLRAAQGSATVAILTTAGLLLTPITDAALSNTQTALLACAIGFGALGLSHINDSGFWIVTRYLGLSVKDGLRTWTVLSTGFSVAGFALTWAAYALV